MTSSNPQTTPKTIEAMLAETIKDAVEKKCVTEIPDDDDSRADHVIIGKPTRELRDEMVISIHMRHPFGPRMDKDTAVHGLPRSSDSGPWVFPAETMGGMRVERIIGCVQIRLRKRQNAEEASWLFEPVKERIRQAINCDASLSSLSDDFGNTMFWIETFRATGYDSGGGEVSLTNQWVDFRAFVSSTNCRS
jgi:hypothetical protein